MLLQRCRLPSTNLCHRFGTNHSRRASWFLIRNYHERRQTHLTLAIETSCDDTAVAILSRTRAGGASLLFNDRISSDNREFKGVHPVVTVQGHNGSLAPLVQRALEALPDVDVVGDREYNTTKTISITTTDGDRKVKRVPDFVSVTRGPGIMANLAVGLNMAKGLAVAWGVPLLGVHHMQAHALTPRLVRALGMKMMGGNEGERQEQESRQNGGQDRAGESIAQSASPQFPFLSLLVSGGHTQLVHSASLTDHRIVATTGDIAIGNLLDQTARVILPPDVLQASPDVMYGRQLEAFAFPNTSTSTSTIPSPSNNQDDVIPRQHADFFRPATRRQDEITDVPSGYEWTVPLPFRNSRRLAYSFSSIHTHVHRIAAANPSMDTEERRCLARHTMRAAFQHLASRLCLALEDRPELRPAAKTLVVAGGVASNRFLMHVLRETLRARGYPDVSIMAPPVALCTDNAAMIAWTAMEMYEAGYVSDLSVLPIGKWPMDPEVGPGIMGVDGWLRLSGRA